MAKTSWGEAGMVATSPGPRLSEAYAYCERLARTHYENFTVASWFLPKQYRPSLLAVYAFCRLTDDLGDEADGDRLAALDAWELDLRRSLDRHAEHPALVALQDTVQRHGMPQQPFLDLIEANRMDQRVNRYQTFEDLLRYCRCSANPVGRMVLAVFGYTDQHRGRLSDDVCTGLQLANFWQDVRRDFEQGRLYLPLEDLRKFDYSVDMLQDGVVNEAFRQLIRFEAGRARGYFQRGQYLEGLVAPALRIDLRLFRRGGEAVLDAIERAKGDVWTRRPVVGRIAKARLVMGAVAALGGQRLLGGA